MKNVTLFQNIEFLKNSTGSDQGKFRVLAYSGAIVDRLWGKLIIDLAGITANQAIPIFRDHDSSKIIGFSVSSFTDNSGFHIEGKFCGTPYAEEAKKLSKEGYPWRSSIGVQPLEVSEIGAGETRLVNNQTVSGPCEVWTKSEVFETSFVSVPADNHTTVATFTKDSKNMTNSTRGEWDSNPSLRQEFGDIETYQAFRQAEESGLIKTIGETGTSTKLARITDENPQAQWAASAALREEFGDYETFNAFYRNQHLVKIIRGGR